MYVIFDLGLFLAAFPIAGSPELSAFYAVCCSDARLCHVAELRTLSVGLPPLSTISCLLFGELCLCLHGNGLPPVCRFFLLYVPRSSFAALQPHLLT